MKLLTMKTQANAVVLSGGRFYVGFGEYEKVTAAMVTGDYSNGISGTMYSSTVSGYQVRAFTEIVSSNQVQVNVQTVDVLGAVAAVASGVIYSGNIFTVIANGE